MLEKQEKHYRRHKKIRVKVFGTAKKPRLCVFRSNKHIYSQLIDDEKGKTLIVANDKEFKKLKSPVIRAQKIKNQKLKESKQNEIEEKKISGKIVIAYEVGKLIAERALKKKIEKVVFDRGGYKYHGRIKALAQGAREKGLKF